MPRFSIPAVAAAVCLTALSLFVAPALGAPTDQDVKSLKQSIQQLKKQMKDMQQKYERRISDFEKRLPAPHQQPQDRTTLLQKEIDNLLDRLDSTNKQLDLLESKPGSPATYMDVSFNSLFTVGSSTAPESMIPVLEGGHHDPHKRGFTVNNDEIVLNGAVDPYFNGTANIVYTIDEKGDTVVELEEAYLKTTDLPYRLQFKAGQFFPEFGRINPQHPHQWDFVDAPIVNTRFLGDDGLRGPGAVLSWLAPTSFPLEVQYGALNANGSTAYSFLGSSEGQPFGRAFDRSVRTFKDLISTARISAEYDVTPDLPIQIGVSGAWGPSGATPGSTTSMVGADFVAKWHPAASNHGWPFVTVQAEWMQRHYPYAAFSQKSMDRSFPGGSLDDSGYYVQATWGFMRNWTVGARYGRVHGDFQSMVGLDDRDRVSAALTYYTSHFADLRLQVNHDHMGSTNKDYTSVWLQLQINLGAHPAHKF